MDSSDFAFQTKITSLAPIDEISVLIPDDLVGAVMGDLSGRRAGCWAPTPPATTAHW